MIVLTFCENDQIDDEVFARGGSGGLLPSFPGKRWLRDHSRLYSFLYEKLYSLMYYRLFVSNGADSQRVEHAPEGLAVEASSREHQVLGSDVWWDRTARSTHAFHSFYTNFVPHGVMLIQTTEFWNREQSGRLRAIADRERLLFVDLSEDAPGMKPEDIRLDFDPHWNPEVHRISAERLFREIEGRLDEWKLETGKEES